MEGNTLHLKVGFGKESDQFFDFIRPALVHQLLGQLEAEGKRRRERERQDLFFIIRGVHLYHGRSEVCSGLHCSGQERQINGSDTSSVLSLFLHFHMASFTSSGLFFLFFMLTICPRSCFGFCVFLATVGKKNKKRSRMFKATRQLRRQLKQSSLDRQQQVERRRVTVCSRPSCQAYYCNDFYCFKMSRHTPETQCMKVISFHCEQTEASLRGNRPMVWPFQ